MKKGRSGVGWLGGSRTRTRFGRGSVEVRGSRTSTEGRERKAKGISRRGHADGARRRKQGVDLESPEEVDRRRTTLLLLLSLSLDILDWVTEGVGRTTKKRKSFSDLLKRRKGRRKEVDRGLEGGLDVVQGKPTVSMPSGDLEEL